MVYVWHIYDIVIHTYFQTALFALAPTGASHEHSSHNTIELLNWTCRKNFPQRFETPTFYPKNHWIVFNKDFSWKALALA